MAGTAQLTAMSVNELARLAAVQVRRWSAPTTLTPQALSLFTPVSRGTRVGHVTRGYGSPFVPELHQLSDMPIESDGQPVTGYLTHRAASKYLDC